MAFNWNPFKRKDASERKDAPERPTRHEKRTNWMLALGGALGLGILFLIVLAFGNGPLGFFAAATASLLVGGAAAAIGGILGFLFGIPRAKQDVPAVVAENGAGREYSENTNLEQISDWLTKIIVGLTLVEFDAIRAQIVTIGAAIGPSLISAEPGMQTGVGISIILYFLILGFLLLYLWTRIYMEEILRLQSARAEQKLKDLVAEQGNEMAAVVNSVTAHLEIDVDPSPAEIRGLKEEIRKASVFARTLVFNEARRMLDTALDGAPDAPQLAERTVPIWEALIAANPNRYHRNYAKLGQALMLKPNPDWAGARDALQRAIDMRKDRPSTSAGRYEYALARALIHLDPKFQSGDPSDPAQVEKIAPLLNTARDHGALGSDQDVQDWAALNGYTL